MSRIDTFLRRLDSILELPEYHGSPTFIENIQANAQDDALPREEAFLQLIRDLSVRTTRSYVDQAADRAHVLRSACSHMHGVLESKILTPCVAKHLDCLSVVAVAIEGRQEKEWDDSEQLRLSASRTVDELLSDSLTREEILGDETYDRELRTLREFSANKRDSHSVWKLMARVVRAYLASAKAFAHHLHLKDVLGHDLKENETARRLASRFGITNWDTLREELRNFMRDCETVTYLDLSCIPNGLDMGRWTGVVGDMLHGFSGSIHIGRSVIFRIAAGAASSTKFAMKTEETYAMKQTFDLVFHTGGRNGMKLRGDTCMPVTQLFRSHEHDVDTGDWYVNGTRIRQRVHAHVRRHMGGYRDIVVSVNDRSSKLIVIFMVQFREVEEGYEIAYGFQDPRGPRRDVVDWPSRSFLELWLDTLSA
jgi:hypothetical protein